ncbi:hypothetical protein [Streptomyces violaceus]|uniref:Uncharacterized protein n=1 Tax=Streptomyces violaceus TaxID=1936 RepID=A0ABY9UMN2_STRVL|nr:hypothetical protein [Streptomyces janthinus]WND24149.1 hypothetical protein RI060_43290 [Streptomyces janthinus]GGS96858.1 hypothetical protein GCM10010270_81050 [Streptomyces janthinus]
MTTHIPSSPAGAGDVPEGVLEDAAFDAMRTDAVLTGRAMSAGAFLAGLIANAQLATVSRPEKLAADLFPDVDPEVVQRIWDRALAVGLHAGRRSASPRLYRDEMDRVAGQFAKVGYAAMGGTVARSRRLVAPDVPVHPADGETTRER